MIVNEADKMEKSPDIRITKKSDHHDNKTSNGLVEKNKACLKMQIIKYVHFYKKFVITSETFPVYSHTQLHSLNPT